MTSSQATMNGLVEQQLQQQIQDTQQIQQQFNNVDTAVTQLQPVVDQGQELRHADQGLLQIIGSLAQALLPVAGGDSSSSVVVGDSSLLDGSSSVGADAGSSAPSSLAADNGGSSVMSFIMRPALEKTTGELGDTVQVHSVEQHGTSINDGAAGGGAGGGFTLSTIVPRFLDYLLLPQADQADENKIFTTGDLYYKEKGGGDSTPDLETYQMIFAVVLFLVTALAVVVRMKCMSGKNCGRNCIDLCNLFAAGMFLGNILIIYNLIKVNKIKIIHAY